MQSEDQTAILPPRLGGLIIMGGSAPGDLYYNDRRARSNAAVLAAGQPAAIAGANSCRGRALFDDLAAPARLARRQDRQRLPFPLNSASTKSLIPRWLR